MENKITTFENYKQINKNYLKKIVIGLFDVKVPESIEPNYLMEEILFNGWCGIFKYKNEIVASKGTYSGIGRYYKPLYYTHSEPFFADDTTQRKVGEDCILIYNSKFYRDAQLNGLANMVDVFASRLAEIDLSIDTSIINSRVTLVPVVDDINEARRTKDIIDQMREGQSAVLSYKTSFNNKDSFNILPIKARDNIVVMELSDARRNVLSDFYNCLGVQNLAVDKKERTNLDEMDSNKQQLSISLDEIYEPIKRGFDEVNALFETDFTIDKKEVLTDEKEAERLPDTDK